MKSVKERASASASTTIGLQTKHIFGLKTQTAKFEQEDAQLPEGVKTQRLLWVILTAKVGLSVKGKRLNMNQKYQSR